MLRSSLRNSSDGATMLGGARLSNTRNCGRWC